MKKVKLLVTMPIHGALVAKGETVELDEKEARLLVTTDRAEYVEPATEAPAVGRGKARTGKGPGENRGKE